ncbi:MAG: substrate-binding periplasmic protein [Alphaproteobacteria bacterium]
MEHLKIGYEPDFAPLTFMAGAQAAGLVVDIVTDAVRRGGMEAAFVSVDLPDQDAALRSGDVDALAFKAIIAERAGSYDFSAPLTTSGAAWFAVDAARLRPDGDPVSGARVATPVRGPLSAQIRRDFPELSVINVDTYAAALTAVLENRADIAALNFHVGFYLAQRDHAGRFLIPTAPFQEMPLGLAVSAGKHAALLAAIDRGLAEMRRDGTIGEIETRWLAAS